MIWSVLAATFPSPHHAAFDIFGQHYGYIVIVIIASASRLPLIWETAVCPSAVLRCLCQFQLARDR